MKSAIAIAAHPDDIEFQMAGTLLLLKEAGWETHYLNLSTGNCGSAEFSPKQTRAVRRKEAQAAARVLGAHWHAPLCDDLEILYEVRRLRQLSAVIRETQASIVLTHSPHDYMEDHTNTCRLAVTAAFTHGMPNFRSVPARAVYHGDVTVYHSMPHGLRDGLRRRMIPGAYVNTASVQATKLAALACHQSQQGWLDLSQGLNSYLQTMADQSQELGRMSRKFSHAEGWRRHSHLGFCAEKANPLREALGEAFRVNAAYERSLEAGRGGALDLADGRAKPDRERASE